MATLALGVIGTLVGGPVGGAIGALAGRQIDASIIGGSSREGPRLNDLTITTSSFGTPIAKHYGQMRTAGTIIWATDLQENRETSGGGKGKPSTTNFSYTTSFAVALSSRPITGLGRIWADGSLLRGAAGDLKVGGTLRIYNGHGDQQADQFIAASEGPECPAFRGRAYAVFEGLQLEDFGNRIPALSFEVFADDQNFGLADIVEPLVDDATASLNLDALSGFSYEGGSLARSIDTLGALFPVVTSSSPAGFSLRSTPTSDNSAIVLPESMPAWEEGDFGQSNGFSRERAAGSQPLTNAIRYYDTSRDYQPGVQRPEGRANLAGNQTLQFPGALSPDDARFLINQASTRAMWANETLLWRLAELDPALSHGSLVSVPDIPGKWIVTSWEWRERGVELTLERAPRGSQSGILGDAGIPTPPPDDLPFPTNLRVFELPWDGIGSPDASQIFAATSAESQRWSGAALFSSDNGPLSAIGSSGRNQATMGELASPLSPSSAILFEPEAYLEIEVISEAMSFASVGMAELASGQNRLVVGNEIVQFAAATPVNSTLWRLEGLLRGRGGSEAIALQGHNAGTAITLVDSQLIALDPTRLPPSDDAIVAAIGRGDEAPVMVPISNRGSGQRPLSPVHPRVQPTGDGGLLACWTRRARGAWNWFDGVETPLYEALELYRVGIGDTGTPAMVWEVNQPEITLNSEQVSDHPGQPVWVMQIGRVSLSPPLLLEVLP